MDNKILEVAKKVERLLADLNKYRQENEDLLTDNKRLRSELAAAGKEFHALKLDTADHSETVRTKLAGILAKLSELESMRS